MKLHINGLEANTLLLALDTAYDSGNLTADIEEEALALIDKINHEIDLANLVAETAGQR